MLEILLQNLSNLDFKFSNLFEINCSSIGTAFTEANLSLFNFSKILSVLRTKKYVRYSH